MTMTAVLTMIGAALLSVVSARPALMPDQYARGVDWLIRYGYLPSPESLTGRLQTREGIEEAVRKMQCFAGIEETGKLDHATLELMARPRCSLPDTISSEDLLKGRRRGKGKLKRRYTLPRLSWDKADITWSVQEFPSPSMSPTLHPGLVRLILTSALRVWSDVTPLRFHPPPYGPSPQIDIKVTFASSYHEDGYPFDGKGGNLAHAFFPGKGDLAGDTHFDDGESWSYGDWSSATDLFTVAVHEFGHALGLFHSSSNDSIMNPYYHGPVGDMHSYSLSLDDRLRIQALYGKRQDFKPSPSVVAPTTHLSHSSTPAPPNPPYHPPASADRCQGGYDAVANIRGEVLFFRGPHFWRVHHSGSLISLTPALIHSFWMGLPPETARVDAVYERRDGHILFFIGNQYWVFRDTVSLPEYPRPLSEWGLRTSAGGLPERVEAVFVWPHNGKTYLFSGGEYWRFDESGTERKLEEGYPKPASIWGMPSHPDDIIGFVDRDTYFFKESNYWILKRGGLDQESASPKSIAIDWMKCEGHISTHTPEIPRRDKDCTCVQSTAAMICVLSYVIYPVITGWILVLVFY
ncbi:matrix metalloproteinase-25-like isoform X1 [Sinocyclocheilus rhinocerous]|uniref:matrix metalloproteinase-25-like isoform X1 n=1 Tax=Sinocyclocheilus rhinocerous TaxID=307959 RepID=UPI0007B8683F|nr:PREDICTED: matrix metalloproteinase-25-like isoform X1 [Sinocyclocheilus rhinocerous]